MKGAVSDGATIGIGTGVDAGNTLSNYWGDGMDNPDSRGEGSAESIVDIGDKPWRPLSQDYNGLFFIQFLARRAA